MGPRKQRLTASEPRLSSPSGRHLVGYRRIARRLPSGGLYAWEFEKDGEAVDVAKIGPAIFNGNRLVMAGEIDGLGLGFVLADLAEPAIARGDLVQVLEDWCSPFTGFFLYYPSRRRCAPLCALSSISLP